MVEAAPPRSYGRNDGEAYCSMTPTSEFDAAARCNSNIVANDSRQQEYFSQCHLLGCGNGTSTNFQLEAWDDDASLPGESDEQQRCGDEGSFSFVSALLKGQTLTDRYEATEMSNEHVETDEDSDRDVDEDVCISSGSAAEELEDLFACRFGGDGWTGTGFHLGAWGEESPSEKSRQLETQDVVRSAAAAAAAPEERKVRVDKSGGDNRKNDRSFDSCLQQISFEPVNRNRNSDSNSNSNSNSNRPRREVDEVEFPNYGNIRGLFVQRCVRFSTTPPQINHYPKPSAEEGSHMWYSCHELQRMIDENAVSGDNCAFQM